MVIKSLHYKNFRQFKDENTLEFASGNNNNVTVILGNNTYGKTTLLQMFNWCFYGKADFNDNPNFLLNLEVSGEMYNGSDPETVLVEIVLDFEGREYVITRRQNYYKFDGDVEPKEPQLKISYRDSQSGVTATIDKERDMVEVINQMLPEDLSGYFFFDTERVQNVAKRSDLSVAVKGLLNLTPLENAMKHLGHEGAKTTVIGSFYEDLSKNDDSKLQNVLAKLQEAENEHVKQSQLKQNVEKEIEYYEGKKGELEGKLRSMEEASKLQAEKEDLQKKQGNKETSLERQYSEYKGEFSAEALWFFAQPLFDRAKEMLQQIDIEDKGVTDVTAATIHELIEKGRCLCGAEISQDNYAYRQLMEQLRYVPPESIGVTLKNFQKDLDRYERGNAKVYPALEAKMKLILETRNDIQDILDDIAEIEKKIEGKENAKQYQIELGNVEGNLRKLGEKRDAIIGRIAASIKTKEECKAVIDSMQAKSAKGREIRLYLQYANAVQEWIEEYYHEQEDHIRSELQEHVNEIFKRMYSGERILEIDDKYRTILYSVIPETGEKVLSGESEGLIRVKNFAFIAGLVELAKVKAIKVGDKEELTSEPYPLILDAPFSNADEVHIKNISRELPQVAEQVIMFVMQKDWRYAKEVMQPRTGRMYQLAKHSDTYSSVELYSE